MQERNYWDRFQRQRISRRRLLRGTAALGAGAAGIAILGCDDDGDGAATPGPGDTPAAGETPAAMGKQTEPVGTRGGIFRDFSFDALPLDTRDPLQTQFGPMYNMHSAVFSKVLQYEDEIEQVMSPDLADSIPESADGMEWVITLNDNIFFHDTPQIQSNFPDVAGRRLTAEDVRYSIARQVSEAEWTGLPASPRAELYYRKFQWQPIERVEVIDDRTLRIVTSVPLAPFLHYLADRNSFIIARELVDENDEMNDNTRMVGSGPFMLEDLTDLQFVKARRNPNWFAKDLRPELGMDRPFIDGYDALWTPQNDQAQEVALKNKEVDTTGFEDDNNTLRIEQEVDGLELGEIGVGGSIGVRMLVDRPPFNDVRLRRALHLAFNRSVLGEQMFPAAPGRVGALPTSIVGWPSARWALPREELDQMPGYRFTQAERDQDLADARQLWEAANGPGNFNALAANIPAYIPNKGTPEMMREAREALNFALELETTDYVELAQCLLRNQQDAPEGTCAYTFGFDNGWIDLDDWLYPFFHSTGSKNSFRLADSELDRMLEEQRQEFDFETRQQMGYDIQRYFMETGGAEGMGVLAALPLVNGITRSLAWNYIRNRFTPQLWFGQNFLHANVWLDQNDPNWAGRPT